MNVMATQTLTLKRHADGYFRTAWTDEQGRRHRRAFGNVRAKALNEFNAFHIRWRVDASVRSPTDAAEQTLKYAWDLYKKHAEAHYRHLDGTPTGEAATIGQAMAVMLALFGERPLREIDAKCVDGARLKMAETLAVSTINAYVRKIRHVWKWFVQQGHANATVWHGMMALEALKPGRGLAAIGKMVVPRVTDPVQPAVDADVIAVRDALPLTLRTMVMVQYFTGMRPSELCIMRPVDIDTSGTIWLYKPTRHKTQHHGKARVVAIGPQAQAWLRPILERTKDLHACLFSPRAAWSERMETRRAAYVPKQGQGDYRRWKRVVDREPNPRGGDVFDRTTYARAIARVCDDLGIPRWSPNRLRHAAGTRARKEMGLDEAAAMLGHSKVSMTELYAKIATDKATMVAERVG